MENVDYSLYPDREYQMKWLRMYLELKAVHRGSASSTVTDRDVEVLYVQLNKFALVGKQDLYKVKKVTLFTFYLVYLLVCLSVYL